MNKFATKINNREFIGREDITSYRMDKSVNYVGHKAFYECTNLSSISFSNNVMFIGEAAFEKCASLQTVEIPDKVKIIEAGTFALCKSLRDVKLGKSVDCIKTEAFFCCDSLENVIVNDNLSCIYDNVFYKCYSLKSVTLPKTTTIAQSAFNGCNDLSLIIKCNIDEYDKTIIGFDSIGRIVFNNCTVHLKNGLRHNIRGPAMEYNDGSNDEYIIMGKKYTKSDYEEKAMILRINEIMG